MEQKNNTVCVFQPNEINFILLMGTFKNVVMAIAPAKEIFMRVTKVVSSAAVFVFCLSSVLFAQNGPSALFQSNSQGDGVLTSLRLNDSNPPQITCPGDDTIFTLPNICGAPLAFNVVATDDSSGVASLTGNYQSGDTFPVGVTEVKYIATDSAGNVDSCSFEVTVIDNVTPTIDCPNDTTLSCIVDSFPVNLSTIQVGDNCPGAQPGFVRQVFLGGLGCVGNPLVYEREFLVIDDVGNQDTCTYKINIVDDIDPEIVLCPKDTTITCTTPPEPALVGTALGEDNCAINVNPNITNIHPSGLPCGTIYQYEISDSFGVVEQDTCFSPFGCSGELPHWGDVELLNDSLSLFLYSNINPPWAISTITYLVDSAGAFNIEPITNLPIIDSNWETNNSVSGQSGTITIELDSLTDSCVVVAVQITIGFASFGGTIKPGTERTLWLYSPGWQNSTAPSLSPFAAGYCVQTCEFLTYPVVLFNDFSEGGICPINRTITRVWSAQDLCNNVVTCEQTITIIDTTAPIAVCPADILVFNDSGFCGANVDFDGLGTDECQPQVTLVTTYSTPPSSFFSIGTTSVSFSVTDACNRTDSCSFNVTVNDTTAPSIVCPPGITLPCLEDVPVADPSLVTAGDNCPGFVVTFGGDTDNGGAGCSGDSLVITRTYTVTDSSGNSASCQQVITVEDTIAPTIVCPPDLTINCSASTDTSFTGAATASDNCGVISGGNFGGDYVLADSNGGEIITYCGSLPCFFQNPWGSAAVSGSGTSYTADISLDQNWVILSVDYLVDEVDSFNLNILNQPVYDSSWTTIPVSGFPTTYTADFSVPASGCNGMGMRIEIIFSSPFTGFDPLSIQYLYLLDTNFVSGPSGSGYLVDFCNQIINDLQVAFTDSVIQSCGSSGVVVRTFTAVDACNTDVSCVQNITIIDTVSPSVSCPADIVVSNDPGDCSAVVTYSVVATDNCDPSPVVTSSPSSGSSFPTGTSTVAVTATDSCANSDTCSFSVTVNDVEEPNVVCDAITVTLDINGLATITNSDVDAGSSDNCSIANITLDSTQFDCNTTSPQTVTLTIADVSGNVDSCTAEVTIEDTLVPTAVCQNITIQIPAGDSFSISTSDIDGGSFDNCGIDSLSVCSKPFILIDFDLGPDGMPIPPGTNITTQFRPFGIDSVSAKRGLNQAWIFDSSNPTGGDYDLGSPSSQHGGPGIGAGGATNTTALKNILIIQQWNDTLPNDNKRGGKLTLEFINPVTLGYVTLVDIDEIGDSIILTTSGGLVNFPISPVGDNSVQQVDMNTSGVTRMDIKLKGSGALADVSFREETCTSTLTCANVGQNTVELFVVDDAGNVDSCSSTITVECTNSLRMACPGNVTVPCGSSGGAIVNWSERSMFNRYKYVMEVPYNSNATLTQVVGPASGDFFPEGVTKIVYTAKNEKGNTDSCSFNVTVDQCQMDYCQAIGQSSREEWISNVTIGQINNTSGDNKGYADFTDRVDTLAGGFNAFIQLTPGFSASASTEYWTVWIDWNRDGDFYDSGEQVFRDNGSNTVSGFFDVPEVTSNGPMRMRVTMQWDKYVPGPCSSIFYGEVEDYTVYVNAQNVEVATTGDAGQGSSDEERIYEFDQFTSTSGIEFYRFFPNPVSKLSTHDVKIEFRSGKNETITLRVTDFTGKVLDGKLIDAKAGLNHALVNISELPVGSYFVELASEKTRKIKKLVVQ